jgi:hypothetical protein
MGAGQDGPLVFIGFFCFLQELDLLIVECRIRIEEGSCASGVK